MTGLVNKEANKLSWVMYFFFYKDFIYLFMRAGEREREREAETQAEGEVGSMQGARCGTQSQDPGSCSEPKADRCSTTEPPRHPGHCDLVEKVKHK